MNWEPRNGAIYTNNDSQLTLHDVITTQGDGDSWYVSWHFSLIGISMNHWFLSMLYLLL